MFGCLMAGASVQAHHSTAGIYDPGKEGTVTGALAAIKFVNPHGSVTKVGPNALKIGEQLTVTFTPARNGAPLGALKTIKRADGTVIGTNPNE